MSEQLGDESYSYMAGPKGFTPKVKIDMDDVTRFTLNSCENNNRPLEKPKRKSKAV